MSSSDLTIAPISPRKRTRCFYYNGIATQLGKPLIQNHYNVPEGPESSAIPHFRSSNVYTPLSDPASPILG